MAILAFGYPSERMELARQAALTAAVPTSVPRPDKTARQAWMEFWRETARVTYLLVERAGDAPTLVWVRAGLVEVLHRVDQVEIPLQPPVVRAG